MKDGHILRFRVSQIVLIDQPHTTVDDGFLHRGKSILAGNDQFAQAKNKVRLEG